MGLPLAVEAGLPDCLTFKSLSEISDPRKRLSVAEEAGRGLAKNALMAMVRDDAPPPSALLDAWSAVALDDGLDPAFRALALNLPGQDDMAQTLADASLRPVALLLCRDLMWEDEAC